MQNLQDPAVVDPPGPGEQSTATRAGPRSWFLDMLGVSWVVVAGIAVLVPALAHGIHLGPFDLMSQLGLSKIDHLSQAGQSKIHAAAANVYFHDQVTAIMPWTTLASTQVHHGLLPLWNPYGGLGMPLSFNWQSATFSLPALVGYLVPAQFSYTVTVIVTVIVAGTGAYFLGRVLHLGVLGSAMVGTVFELSGPFIGWLGWPHAAVISWAGWLFGAALLIARGGRRAGSVALFAVVFAFAVYAGQPEILAMLLLSLGVFLIVLMVQTAWREGARSILHPVTDLAIATVCGGALAAPLALPGLQLANRSVHTKVSPVPPLPLHDLLYLVLQGFDGLPVAGSQMFGPWGFFYIGAYVGVIAVVLAIVAIVLRRRSPEVVAFAATAIITGGIAFASFSPFLVSLIDHLPVVGTTPARFLLAMALPASVLAGVGIDVLAHGERDRAWRWTGSGFAVAGVVLIALFFNTVVHGHLSAVDHQIRTRSFIWPAIEVLVGLAAAVGVVLAHRRQHGDPPMFASGGKTTEIASQSPLRLGPARWAGLGLLACETVFLVTAGAPLWSSSSTFYAPTPAVTALQRAVGSSVVGLGLSKPGYLCTKLGITPNVNDVYAVHELAVYDPTVPRKYFTALQGRPGVSAGNAAFNDYCPTVTTVSLARLYGVSYILEPADVSGPAGTEYVGPIGNEGLYRVPRSYPATLTDLGAGGQLPSADAQGTPITVVDPDPAKWKMVTSSTTPQVLRLRLNNVPGWHASIDGRPLQLRPFAGIMLQADIPPGHHVIELHYWPATFSIGIVLAACSLAGLSAALIVGGLRRRRKTALTSDLTTPVSSEYR